jgi:hypothetical protein
MASVAFCFFEEVVHFLFLSVEGAFAPVFYFMPIRKFRFCRWCFRGNPRRFPLRFLRHS